jgi:hypothetical protein
MSLNQPVELTLKQKSGVLPSLLWNPIPKACCLIDLNPYRTRLSSFSMHYLIIMLSGSTIKLPEEPKAEGIVAQAVGRGALTQLR